MKRTTTLLTILWTCVALSVPVHAAFTPQATAVPGSAPQGINYQGRLEDNGSPVTGIKLMVFRVYDAPTGGNLLWTSPAQTVNVTIGLFNVPVPTPISALVGGGARYLEVQIDGTLMAPRELLNSVPYALIAKSVEGTIDVSTAGLSIFANASAAQPSIFISSLTGNVGVGGTAPATPLDVNGAAQFGNANSKSTFTAAGNLRVPGSVTAGSFSGDGAGLTNVTGTPIGPAGGNLGGTYPNPSIASLPVISGANLTSLTGANVSGNIPGNAATATNLQLEPPDCAAGNAAAGITANGTASGCFIPVTTPSGMVSFFNLAVCPAGWTALAAARGRYLVGVPLAGTLAGTAGSVLTDQEDRAVGQHTHGLTDPGHTHTGAVVYGLANYAGPGGFAIINTGPTGSATTGITISPSGGVVGTNAPYLQLLVCQKD